MTRFTDQKLLEDELVEYFIVNSDLNMSPGKVAAQVGHAATMIAVRCYDLESFQEWFNNDQKKVILKGKQKDLEKILDKLNGFTVEVRDNGLNEVEPGSLTVVGIIPMYRSIISTFVKRLQLY